MNRRPDPSRGRDAPTRPGAQARAVLAVSRERLTSTPQMSESVSSSSAQTRNFVARPCCPACGATRFTTLLRLDFLEPRLWGFLTTYYRSLHANRSLFEGAIYQLDQCAACSLVFQRFVGDDQLLTLLYDTWLSARPAPTHDPVVRAAHTHPAQSRDGHELFAAAHHLGTPVERLRVLDYGMGWGLWAGVARRLGCTAFGFDLSPTRRAHAASDGITVVTREEIPDLSLDFINTDQVLEHLTDPYEDTARLAKALRPGGILKISVPQAPDLPRRLKRLDWYAPKSSRDSLNPVHPLEHVNCFSPASLEAIAERLGLERVDLPLQSHAAFLNHPRTIPFRSPTALAKAFLRPFYSQHSRRSLLRWFEKPQA